MPCDTVVTNTVELGKITDHALLERAVRAEFGGVVTVGERLGAFQLTFSVDGQAVTLAKGRASSRLPEAKLHEVVGRVKQAFSREVVHMAARRFGWTVQRGADANHFSIVRS